MIDFDLHAELLDAHSAEPFENELLVAEFDADFIGQRLDLLIQRLTGNPTNALEEDIYCDIRSFIRYFDLLNVESSIKFGDVLLDGLTEATSAAGSDIADGIQTTFDEHRLVLEFFAFSTHNLLENAELKARREKREKSAANPSKRAPIKKARNEEGWNWASQRERLLKAYATLLSIDLHRLIVASSERDCLVSMLTKSIALILEDPDTIKLGTTKTCIFEILSVCARKYDTELSKGVVSRISQLIQEEHLAESMAELLNFASEKHSFSELADSVIRESKSWSFNDNELKTAKSFSKFVVKLSELLPERVLKNMVYLQGQVDSRSYTVRMSMLEVIANLVHNHLSTNNSETAFSQILSFFNILQERFRDNKSFVRSKLLQVLLKLAEAREVGVTDIPIERWPVIVSLTIGRLHDKSSNVRKNAVRLLSEMVENSPFLSIPSDNKKQNISHFSKKQEELMDIIKQRFPEEVKEVLPSSDHDTAEESEEVPASAEKLVEMQNNPDKAVELANLRRFLKYYSEGITFFKQLNAASSTFCELLASNVKAEVMEVMKFLVVAYRFDMECSKAGVRKMIHKVWDKESNSSDEEGSIRETLIQCFKSLYLDVESDKERDKNELIVNNLISLLQSLNLAELTSLEQLLGIIAEKDLIPHGAIELLWTVFGTNSEALWLTRLASKRKETPAQRRRGALAILSMLGKWKKDIIDRNRETLLKYGLGEFAKNDLLLAKYACITLQRLGVGKHNIKGAESYGQANEPSVRFPSKDALFSRLVNLILEPTTSPQWFVFTEQALNTIYALAENPDIISGTIIKRYSSRFFKVPPPPDTLDEITDAFNVTMNLNDRMDTEQSPALQGEDTELNSSSDGFEVDPVELSKLCFMVGHVAIKQIAHLEAIETEWKRRRNKDRASKAPTVGGSDLDQVVGTAEDDFSDMIARIRERELLHGQRSLLAIYGPLIVHICKHNLDFNVPILQVMAVLALCKLMCVSSEFCDENLQLLFTILEKSRDPTIRSNTIIGLGDMTVSFNSLIDQNISYLYNRLSDGDSTVKKNALMVLTHLVLNGMVKVKGQISEMAKCLVDEDTRISDLAKLFFSELSTKDNAVYNNLPDIISNLSQKGTGVEEEPFKAIMRYLLEFVKKDRQVENVVEKLCLRFRNADQPRLWRDIGFCLSLINFSTERPMKKFMDAFPVYQDKLHEPTLYKYFQEIVAKAKKNLKGELRTPLEDFEAKLGDAHNKCCENAEALKKASDAAGGRKGRSGKALPDVGSPMAEDTEQEEQQEEEEEDEDGDFQMD
ncbi:Condensin complex subunit [Dinochytrium kinnereticum]|nr:Condensin complex subunit [Dinochytrium kinnereticum]